MSAGKEEGAESLVSKGLQYYSRGEFDRALELWGAALSKNPSVGRAREYMQYVKSNRAALEAAVRAQSLSDGDGYPAQPGGERVPPVDAKDDSIPINVGDLTSSESDPEEFSIDTTLNGAAGYEEMAGLGGQVFDFTDDVEEIDDQADGIELQESTRNVENWSELDSEQGISLDDNSANSADVGSGYVFGSTPLEWREGLEEGDDSASTDRLEPRQRRQTIPVPASGAEESLGREARATGETFTAESSAVRRNTLVSGADGDQDADTGKEAAFDVLEGGGVVFAAEFDPQEMTPVGLIIPEPSLASAGNGVSPDETSTVLQPPLDELPDAPSADDFVESDRTPTSLARSAQQVAEQTANAVAEELEGSDFFSNEPRARGDRPGLLEDALVDAVGDDVEGFSDDGTPVKEVAGPGNQTASLQEQAESLLARGEFEAAMELCQSILQSKPDDDAAQALADRAKGVLLETYERRIGDLEKIPVVQMPEHAIVGQQLDHHAGYLLSRIDGMLSYSDLLDICGMPRFQACRILANLLDRDVIATQ